MNNLSVTKTERLVLGLKMQGLTNKEVSEQLGYNIVGGRTRAVGYLVQSAMKRVGATNAMHLGYLLGSAK